MRKIYSVLSVLKISFEIWGSFAESKKDQVLSSFWLFTTWFNSLLKTRARMNLYWMWGLLVGKVEGWYFFQVGKHCLPSLRLCWHIFTKILASTTPKADFRCTFLIETIGSHLFSYLCENQLQHTHFWSNWPNDYCLLLLTCRSSNEKLTKDT